jgi:hypothetical protein
MEKIPKEIPENMKISNHDDTELKFFAYVRHPGLVADLDPLLNSDAVSSTDPVTNHDPVLYLGLKIYQ